MPETKPDQSEMGKTFTALVRILEAVCQIDYPTQDEQNFRIAIMKKLGIELGRRELRSTRIAGAGTGVPRPAAPASAPTPPTPAAGGPR